MSTSTKQQPLETPTAASSTSSLQIVSLAKIVPSKTNPRKNFEGPEFDELVESIRTHGVLQPVLVRPMFDAEDGELDHFELVAGERRYRASLTAEKNSIPAMVQLLTDEQAMELQIVENLQRKDVTPIEEAEGLQRLLRKAESDQELLPIVERSTRTELVQTIATRIGKSVRYVWARMKLVNLVPEIKQALEAGKIEPSHADVLVTYPPEKQREIFVENFTSPVYDDEKPFDLEVPCGWDGKGEVTDKEHVVFVENPVSVRELKRRLEQEGKPLKSANWKWQKDVDGGLPGALIDGQHAPRCVGCEFNTATESGDTKKATCVNDECFDAKKNYFVQIELDHVEQAAKQNGTKLLKVIDSYFDGYKKKGFLPGDEWKKVGKGSCAHDVDAVQVHDDGSPEKIVHVCATKSCKVHFGKAAAAPKSPEQIKQDQERKAENDARMAIAKKIVASTAKLPDVIVRHMATVLASSWEVRDNIGKIRPDSQDDLKSAKVDSVAFAQACVALGLAAFVHVDSYSSVTRGQKEFEAAVLNLGFDPKKERAELAKSADPKAPKKSKVPSSPKAAASLKTKTTKKAAKKPPARKAAKKSSTKKGGR
jgi:ParB/RepB/Spo0J family partition protein